MFRKKTNMINNYQKTGLAFILVSIFAYFFLEGTSYQIVTGFLLGCGIGLLLWRNKPQKISTATNARYRRSLRRN